MNVLKNSIVCVVAAAAMVHCTQQKSPPVQETAQQTTTVKKRTLVYCSEGSPSSMNPQISEDSTSLNIHYNVYDRLMTYKKGTLELIPSLAESVSISKNGKVYTMVLKDNVDFHSTSYFQPTRSMNADDILFSFNRQRLKKHPFHSVSGGKYLYFESMGLGELIQDIRKVNTHTVEFVLTQPNATFLPMLSMEFTSILSKEYAQKLQSENNLEQLDTLPIGTGPFAFKSYAKDSMLRLQKHLTYHALHGNIDHLVVLITPDASVRSQKMKNKECHVIAEPAPIDYVSFVNDDRFQVLRTAGLTTGYLAFNTKKPPFDQLKVRQAIAHALNRDAYVQAVYEKMGIKADSILPPGLMGDQNLTANNIEYNPHKAVTLLKEAGLEKGFTTDIWAQPVSRPYNPNGAKMAEMMQADLAKVGIKAKIVTYDWPTYLAKTKNGEHSMAQFGWIADIADADNFLTPLLTCNAAKTGSNRSFWCDPAFSQSVLEAKNISDVTQRKALYENALTILSQETPIVPIAHSTLYRVVDKDVQNFSISTLGRDRFDGVNLP